jgi:hypothetical protein
MKVVTLMVAVLTSAAAAMVAAYHTDPVRADWSGMADPRPEYGVSEVITVAFDSLAYCELFSGQASSERYFVDVLTFPGGYPLASGYSDDLRNHVWIRFDLSATHPESIVKGKQLEFRFSHGAGGSDSIQFYFDPFAGTHFDSMIVPGGSFQPPPEPAA